MLEPKTTRPYVEAKTRDGHVMSQAKCKVQVHRFGKLKMMLMLIADIYIFDKYGNFWTSKYILEVTKASIS